jgi:ABC-type multidrug transport system ATPase subunit/pSer/pThr/pTyr-binding forkhead associated (FHA) protein
MSGSYEYKLGRGKDCHLIVNNPFVSRDHARIRWDGTGWSLQDMGSANGTFLNDSEEALPSGSEQPLNKGDIVHFSRHYKLTADLLLKRLREGVSEDSSGQMSVFEATAGVIRIGRAPENDVVLSQLSVSRFHAEIYVRPDGVRELKDLGGKGGTFVNDRQVLGDTVPISKDDRLEVGGVSVCIQFSSKPGGKTVVGRQQEGIYLQSVNLGYRVTDRQTGKPRDLLRDLSLSVFPGEFVGLMGPSGCGKTTFMTSVNGCENFTSGSVYYNGIDLASNLSRFSPQIGYVPQDDIMHPELTVREVLFYTARLKLLRDVSDADVHAKIESVCRDLGLMAVLDTLVGTPEQKTLSGGQKKRVNLAMELLTDPKILFLDEPTSGLSSADTVNVMNLLRKMADDRGIAIVITIHQPSTTVYKLMDSVIYLKAGRLCYYGAAFPGSIKYFVQDQDPAQAGPDAVMEKLDIGDEKSMESEYRKSQSFRELVTRRAEVLGSEKHGSGSLKSRRVPALAQLPGLLKRYLTCKWRDKGSLVILLAQAPLIGFLIGWIFREGSLNPALFLLVFVSLWFGTNNSAKELVGERSIFRREKRSGLSAFGYLGSKLIVQATLTFIQCTLLIATSSVFIDFAFSFPIALGTCWLTSLVGVSAGLCVSAWSKTEVTAIVTVPLILIPFILFGGLLKPYDDMGGLSRFAGFFNPARWGYDAIVQIERDGQYGYAKSPKKMVSELRQALKSVEEGTPASSFESEEPSTFLLPFHEKKDFLEENETSGYRDGRKALAFVMLALMSILTLSACLFKLRSAR